MTLGPRGTVPDAAPDLSGRRAAPGNLRETALRQNPAWSVRPAQDHDPGAPMTTIPRRCLAHASARRSGRAPTGARMERRRLGGTPMTTRPKARA